MKSAWMLSGMAVSLGLVSGTALAEGNWNITNGGVGDFASWAATGGVMPLVGDFNGDGRADIALIRRTAGWNTVPVAFAAGNGNWTITNRGVGAFAGWAANGGVMPLVGDFNGDGRDDIALIRRTPGWDTIPIAFSTSSGWVITNRKVGAFAGWAATIGVTPLVGDFNGDGRDDIALIRRTGGWATIPVARAVGKGFWAITNPGVGAFATWVATSGVTPLTGDFNGDGHKDISLIRRTEGWASIPVAFGHNGNWTITNGGVGIFATWAATPGVMPLTGDFDGDGRDDIALIRRTPGWASIPVAFGQNGDWTIVNAGVGTFADWAATSGVMPLTGDFNGDGHDDIALLRSTEGWASIPVAFGLNGSWNITNGGAGAFAAWAATSGVMPLTGDFNGDGRDDIALIRRTPGWASIPVAFATD